MMLKAFLAAAVAAAVVVGFALPAPRDSLGATHSRVETLTPGRG